MIPHSKPWITKEDCQAVLEILYSGMVAQGAKVREFEKAITNYVGTSDSIAVGSGTAALITALKSLDISKDDEVILPTYVCHNVLDAVIATGAQPVLCDVGELWNITPDAVEPHINGRTKAIIVVHIFGITTNTNLFKIFNIPIIEDCAQAFGAEINGQKVGSIGTIGIYSFHGTKCLTTGEGGIVTSNDIELIEKMQMFRDKGVIASPLSDIQATLGINQLSRYSEMLVRRRTIAELYFKELPGYLTEKIDSVRDRSIFFRFPLSIESNFEKVKLLFELNGIAVRKGVDKLLHWNFNLSDQDFPTAFRLFQHTLSIPIYPSLTADEQEIIISAVKKYYRNKKELSI